MNLASKILVGFVILFALVYFGLAVFALDIHRVWKSTAKRMSESIEQTSAENALQRNSEDAAAADRLVAIGKSPSDAPGRKQLLDELNQLVINRGRMWIANPQPNQAGGPIVLSVYYPEGQKRLPVTLTPKQSVFAFEFPPVTGDAANQAPPGRYLGEFIVLEQPAPNTAVPGTFAVAPAMTLSERESTRLTQSMSGGIPWIVYENLPQDRHGTFAGLDAEMLAKQFPMFSEQQRAEILKDGQPFDPTKDAKERDLAGIYQRPLTDFRQALQESYRVRALLSAEIAALQQDIEYLNRAYADMQLEIKFRNDEVADLQKELQRSQNEHALVAKLLGEIDNKLAAVRATSERLEEENRRLAADLAEKQRQALETLETAQASR